MTQLTGRGTPLSSASAVERGRAAALTTSFLRGALAAGLGLGALAVLVMVMWISSAYPDSGVGGALHVAAGLWLLAHGVELVRPDTLSGSPAPLGLVPMLLVAMPVWLVYRAARDTLDPQEGRPQLTGLGAVCTVGGGYLLVGGAAVLYAASGPLTARPIGAALALPVLTVLSATAGAWTASSRPRDPLPRWLPRAVRAALVRTVRSPGARRRSAVAGRSGAAAALLLLGGGALLVGVSLALHGGPAQESFERLAGDWSGRCAVLLLGLVLVPNAAMWGAAYGLGPGFALGTAATATPLGVVGTPVLPSFPLLAAVPSGPGTPLNWAAGAVPVAAGLAVAWFTVRRAAPPYSVREEAWGAGETAVTAALGGVVCAVLTAALAGMAGGPLGANGLALFGPVWWRTGVAALAWTVGLGLPGALLLRAWRLRTRGVREVPEAPGVLGAQGGPGDSGAWHGSGAREARWAAIKVASGGLMADFPAVAPVIPVASVAPVAPVITVASAEAAPAVAAVVIPAAAVPREVPPAVPREAEPNAEPKALPEAPSEAPSEASSEAAPEAPPKTAPDILPEVSAEVPAKAPAEVPAEVPVEVPAPVPAVEPPAGSGEEEGGSVVPTP
ncbi:DUF6350 family protein [Streptomyces sp. NPDC087850]|uniref:cell division protein PerM n=1 Tax=Streptomyces sp. NPDC087850 TaxID=3365809 RepID=UPI003830845D